MLDTVDFNHVQHIFCLFALSFSFSVGHVGFSSLVNRGFQVFGQFQDLYQIYKLLHRDRSVVNTKGCEENADLSFCIAAFVVHGFLQTLLHIQRRRMAVRSGRIILMGFPNILKDQLQIVRNNMAEILVLLYLCKFQRPQVQIVFRFSLLHQHHLADGLQYSVHIVDPHISDSIHINLRIQHHFLKIMVTDHFRQQPGIEFPGFQNVNRIITQLQSTQLCV